MLTDLIVTMCKTRTRIQEEKVSGPNSTKPSQEVTDRKVRCARTTIPIEYPPMAAQALFKGEFRAQLRSRVGVVKSIASIQPEANDWPWQWTNPGNHVKRDREALRESTSV